MYFHILNGTTARKRAITTKYKLLEKITRCYHFSLSQPTGDDFFSNMVKQENAGRIDADSDANVTQAVCSLQNREECMGCGS